MTDKLKKIIEEENKKATYVGIDPFKDKPTVLEKYVLAYKELAMFIIKTKELLKGGKQ